MRLVEKRARTHDKYVEENEQDACVDMNNDRLLDSPFGPLISEGRSSITRCVGGHLSASRAYMLTDH